LYIDNTRRRRAKRRAGIEDRILINVFSRRNFEWNTGLRDEERTKPEIERQARRAAEEDTMADVEGSTAVILAEVKGLRRDAACVGGIAVGAVEGVIAEEG